jgi:aspartyl-tRNA(Asn)/glutamyl-tRNA(Gln) amidotransferase subunit B
MPLSDYDVIIGLEVHAQLKTRTKIFCSCPAEFGEEPNTNVCPVCLGLPGVLPVLNDQTVKLAIRTGLALGCTIAPRSRFARKHYYYPDLPKGYQITQYTEPLAEGGFLDIPGKRVRVRRCHVEEDAGKLIHAGESSLVDFNRCGVPLIEIVTEPDMRSGEEALASLTALRQILQYLEVSDCDMEKAHFRAELNISVRPRGSDRFQTQTEVKNLNSLRAVRDAIEFEARRQAELTDRGEAVLKQTLLWDDKKNRALPMRRKETAEDYRYFPEPDLPPLVIREDEIEQVRASLPELPAQRKQRYMTRLGLSEYDASVVTASAAFADYYDGILQGKGDIPPRGVPFSKMAANWLTTEVAARLNEQRVGISEFRVPATQVAELLVMIQTGKVTGMAAKLVFAEMAEKGGDAATIVRARGLGLVDDEAQLSRIVDEVVAAETELVAKYRAGKVNVLQALVGAAMRKSRGRFPPGKVNELLTRKLTQT